jgi:hypothetical protein
MDRGAVLSAAGWSTDEELASAVKHFTEKIPGYVTPAAYGVARLDDGNLTFGEVNDVGNTRRLPAVVLAFVCGYSADTATYELSAEQMTEVATLLAPADAAVHMDHPNLWSWRELLEKSNPASTFLAFYLRDLGDKPVGAYDDAFRARLSQ